MKRIDTARRRLARLATLTAGGTLVGGCTMIAAPIPTLQPTSAERGAAGVALDNVLRAHGGRERWRSVSTIEASLDCGGFALLSRFQPSALRRLRARVSPHARAVELRDFTQAGWTGRWSPGRVALHDASDRLVDERSASRRQFVEHADRVTWDTLDVLYFAGYALWNYLSFPFLLEQPGVTVSMPGSGVPGSGRRLLADFGDGFPTHSSRQLFHFDDDWRLIRHDYTADVIGDWATAANLPLRSEEVGGLRLYTRRKVYPRMGSGHTVWPLPLLIWIELDDLAVRTG